MKFGSAPEIESPPFNFPRMNRNCQNMASAPFAANQARPPRPLVQSAPAKALFLPLPRGSVWGRMPQPSPMDGFMRLPRGRGKKRARASEGGDIAVHPAPRGYARNRAKSCAASAPLGAICGLAFGEFAQDQLVHDFQHFRHVAVLPAANHVFAVHHQRWNRKYPVAAHQVPDSP